MAEKKTVKEETSEFFQKAAEQNAERMGVMIDEMSKVEQGALEQMEHSIDEMARLWKQSIHYSIQMNEHMRQIMVESTKRTMDWMVHPRF